jgi:hypothetical protein
LGGERGCEGALEGEGKVDVRGNARCPSSLPQNISRFL